MTFLCLGDDNVRGKPRRKEKKVDVMMEEGEGSERKLE